MPKVFSRKTNAISLAIKDLKPVNDLKTPLEH
jgi:hypothetical protein